MLLWTTCIAAIILLIYSMVTRLGLTLSLVTGPSPVDSPSSNVLLTGTLSVEVLVSFGTEPWRICVRISLSPFQAAMARQICLRLRNNGILKSR